MSDTIIPTTAKIKINDYPELRNIFVEIAKTTVKTNDSLFNDLTLLADREIFDNLNGPFHAFIKIHLKAYRQLTQARMWNNIKEDETLSTKLKAVKSEDNAIQIKPAELEKMQRSLNALLTQQYAEWQEKFLEWRQDLILTLIGQGITISELEINEFQAQIPYSELKSRFEVLHFQPSENAETLNFSLYLKFKSEILIRSILSRQHEAHENSDIAKVMKTLKKNFNKIEKEEKILLKKQTAELKEVLKD